ncbi:SPOSA6832_03801, partial [Sporobolomyces salmonicolor]
MAERWERATKPLPVGAGTEERLRQWEVEVPGYEVEPADWVRKNVETCPAYRIHPNQNRDMLDKAHLLWSSMNTSQVMGLREEMIAYLRRREEEGALKQWGEGRDTFSRVLLTLKMLHHHLHSPLPSEIFSFPGEMPTEEDRTALEALGAKFRVVEDAVKDATHVLYLDSDNIPTAGLSPVDAPVPNEVLESAQEENRTADPWMRKQEGQEEEVWGKPAGLWEGPDYWRTSADNPIWAILGVPCRDEWEQEAGQILIDKSKHLDALLLAEWMMDSSRFKFWFNFSDGDKDMFRFAFLALRKRWAVPGRYVSVGALPRNTMSGFCGHTMLQNDHLGKPMFVHANLLKQIPSGVGRGFAWGRHRQLRTQPSTLTLQTTYDTSLDLEAEDPLTDDDVDADMLANAGNDGIALGEVPEGRRGWRTRRRAAMEKGVRAQFHGGWVSALCIDYHYEDPRSDEELAHAKFSVAQSLPNPANLSLAELAADVDVCYTASPTGFELKFCDEDVTEVVQWEDEPRLRPFENAFFEEGGKLNAKGF